MFTRIVECYVKREKKQDFNDRLQNHVLPILQSQPGFVDMLTLTSEDEPERSVSISLWKSKADADRYHQRHYQEIVDSIRVLLKDEPSVEFTSQPARPRKQDRVVGSSGGVENPIQIIRSPDPPTSR